MHAFIPKLTKHELRVIRLLFGCEFGLGAGVPILSLNSPSLLLKVRFCTPPRIAVGIYDDLRIACVVWAGEAVD